MIVFLPHKHAENRAYRVPNALVEKGCAEPVSAAARLDMRINDALERVLDAARVGDVHAEREELQRFVRDGQAECFLVYEIAPSAHDLTYEYGNDYEVDDVQKVGFFFVAKREEHRAQKAAHEAADYGYAALPNRDDVYEFIPAFETVVSEIFVRARNNVQKSCKDDCKRNEPQKQFHRVVRRYADFLCLPTGVQKAEKHTAHDEQSVPLHRESAD